MIEEWRKIEDCPGYEVSSLGRVSGPRGILSANPGHGGYYGVQVTDMSGRRVNRYVARLVASAFHGAAPSQAHHAAHWNGIKSDNSAANLRWATPKENAEDKRRHGTYRHGESCHQAKLTADKVREIIMWGGLVSRSALGRVYGVSHATIRDILVGRTWPSVSRGII